MTGASETPMAGMEMPATSTGPGGGGGTGSPASRPYRSMARSQSAMKRSSTREGRPVSGSRPM
ncbi:hypothetical protein O0235_02020 [Tepidiforma flava]|uniref:Uncharacterized protein n=1 Tax=Tepidiforma flava TaxID=3004094 RepID=A0ABY7MAN5_9CHLR|nr:hypothetical protein [Tepidiforma flava]WBL37589.1 hypothetical protein O0235_02020 [Tepidiforma flava]